MDIKTVIVISWSKLIIPIIIVIVGYCIFIKPFKKK